jgi:hypothetical protein
VALRIKQTATIGAVKTATANAKLTLTAGYYVKRTATVTPTITQTITQTPTSTFTRTVTPTYTATVDPNAITVPAIGGLFIKTGPLYVNIVQALTWTNTAAGVTFYNATSPTGCVAGNALLTVSSAAVVTNPVVVYQGLVLPDGIMRGTKFTSGLAVSGTASGAVLKLYIQNGRLGY